MVGTPIDVGRLSRALERDGIDTRTWINMARVDEDPDATVWDAELGWLCDVTLVGGPLDEDGPILARLPSSGQGAGKGRYEPPRQGGLVLVAIPNGDTNNDCIILGQLHDSGVAAASKINGTDITEALAARTHIWAFPGEDLDGEFENVRLTGRMTLGVKDADQAFVRGNAQADAFDELLDALSTFLTGAAVPPNPIGSIQLAAWGTAATKLKAAILAYKGKRSQILSSTIRGT